MYEQNKSVWSIPLVVSWVLLFSCHGGHPTKPVTLVSDPANMNQQTGKQIRILLDSALKSNGRIDDSTKLSFHEVVNSCYDRRSFEPIWISREAWSPLADSLYRFIGQSELAGLFPNDYHYRNLCSLRDKLDRDSLKRLDVALWARADIMLTDGFMHVIKDLKLGRLQPDSVTLNKDSTLAENFFLTTLSELLSKKQLSSLLRSLEPKHRDYWDLRNSIKPFIDSMDRRVYTYVTYPYRRGDTKDSLNFIKALQERLTESGVMNYSAHLPDSAQLKDAIRRIQKQKGMAADGKVTGTLIRILDINDKERFKRIAITLDRYKQMPEKMPVRYIWVNLPGFYLKVIDHDSVALESRIICGKPETRTPLLNSQISDMLTYPTWTVPNSIIVKSYLPKLKNNPNYISKIGLKLVNRKGETVDPGSIVWRKYSKGIPFKVMQNSGDNNALGVFKFNFNNPFSVYLHDTNQRYLFKNANRALSHGCVRVQEWQKLAFYIARNDSINSGSKEALKYTADSIRQWIALKERHRIDVKTPVPIYFRYFTVDGRKGKILFYDDIYGEDRLLRDKYFANK